MNVSRARRNFLKFLAASPYVAALGGVATYLEKTGLAQDVPPGQAAYDSISSPKEALNVFDFVGTAKRNMPPGHWANMSSGVDDDLTMKANHEAYQHIELRPRRLRDATKVDMKVDLFGTTYATPIYLCPTSGEQAIHPEGEVGVAKAAKARNTAQALSTMTSMPVEQVVQTLGRPVWQQFYAPNSWDVCMKMMDHFVAAGSTVLALTVDNTTGRNSETFARTRPKDTATCSSCHGANGPDMRARPMFKGIDMTGVGGLNASMDWAFIDKLRGYWKGKLVIKGIDTREDARLAVDHGVDCVMVSNHGGRATETLRPTAQALPEVVAEVNGRIPIFVDGGIRRGTDAFKALALGATAVGIGRPFLWGLGAFGSAGVDRVLEILQAELKLCMGNCGTQKVSDINRAYVVTPADWKV